uniref:Uncharacterized protein n=1 Tax=Tanacetum cinerariifolium TaxID=118510 RepID=A0A699J3R0_TANCI|nr:hypothetical protein [Tanacetum cinerariifolium]
MMFLVPTSLIPSPTPLKSIMSEPLQKPDATKMTMDQFTEHLTQTTSSIFSSTPPREPNLPRDPTPPRDESKGKGIATRDLLKGIMPFIEEGGSAPKIPSFKYFVIPEGQLTQEDVMAHLKEIKRLVDLKAEKEKFKKSLKEILNPATIRAQTQKMDEHEAKKKKMNLVPPTGVERRKGLVIREPESGIFFYNGNFDLVFQREEEFHLATTTQLIRLHNFIQRGSPKAEEMFAKLELTIDARDDVAEAKTIVKYNLDRLGQDM